MLATVVPIIIPSSALNSALPPRTFQPFNDFPSKSGVFCASALINNVIAKTKSAFFRLFIFTPAYQCNIMDYFQYLLLNFSLTI